MATATQTEPYPAIDEEILSVENADEIIDGVPVGRSTDDSVTQAEEEAYEIVDGQILEWPDMGTLPQEIASNIQILLGTFVRQSGLGRTMCAGKFQMIPERQRRPDVAFVSFERWPKTRRLEPIKSWAVSPDLAVEVVSGNDEAWGVIAKVREYFDAGVRAVWLVYPNVEVVHVYHSFTQIEVVTRGGTLDGGTVVPGFRLPLAELFEGEAEPEAGATGAPVPEPTD